MPAYTSVIVTRLIVVYGTEANIRNMSRNDGSLFLNLRASGQHSFRNKQLCLPADGHFPDGSLMFFASGDDTSLNLNFGLYSG